MSDYLPLKFSSSHFLSISTSTRMSWLWFTVTRLRVSLATALRTLLPVLPLWWPAQYLGESGVIWMMSLQRNCLANQLLNISQISSFFCFAKGKGDTIGACPACTAYAVYISFRNFRNRIFLSWQQIIFVKFKQTVVSNL